MIWISRLFRRSALERDLDKELRFHLDAAIDDLVRGGMSRIEAERVARIELGGVEQVKEDARDARGTRWIEDWITDTRYALRSMVRTPAFSLAAILTLAIGIGANVSVWRLIDALVRRPLPVDQPEQLHAVKRIGIEEGVYRISRPTLLEMRAALAQTDSLDLAGMSSIASAYATIGEQPERVLTQLVTGNFFTLLGVRAQIGRLLSTEDDSTLGGTPVVVFSDRYWERRYARDASVIGKSIRLNGTPVTIIGVAERGFGGLTVATPVDVFAPTTMQHELRIKANASSEDSDTEKPWGGQPGIAWLTLITRVDRSDSAAIAARLHPALRAWHEQVTPSGDTAQRANRLRERIALEPISRGFSFVRNQFGEPLRVLMASVSLILLIACANLAGLLLARGAARTHETAVRVSLGARPARLVRQALTESLTLAAIGGIAGVVLSQWMTAALLRLGSSGTRPIPLDVSVSGQTALFALLITLGTGALFGLAPALRMARADLYESFRRGGRGVSGHRVPLGRALVVGQIALSLILIASAGVFVRTFQNLINVDPGFDRGQVVAARIDVRAAGYTPEQLPALYEQLLSSVRAIPGVRSASLTLNGFAGLGYRISGFRVPARNGGDGSRPAEENYVTPEFFATTGITFIAGRGFTGRDTKDSPRVVVLTEMAAKRFFGGADSAVGKRMGYERPNLEVVGVVRDVRPHGLREEQPVLIFHPLAQGPQEYATSLEARVAGNAEIVVPAVRRAIAAVDVDLPVSEVTTMESLLERGLSREKLIARLASGFGVLALLLAAIGLYGVISYSVARRTNEMGVRLALGASPAAVSWVVIRESLRTIALGLAVGVVLWFPLLRLTRQLVYGLSPHDPVTLAFSTGLLLLVGLAAAFLPAKRAARIDPIEAIRAE